MLEHYMWSSICLKPLTFFKHLPITSDIFFENVTSCRQMLAHMPFIMRVWKNFFFTLFVKKNMSEIFFPDFLIEDHCKIPFYISCVNIRGRRSIIPKKLKSNVKYVFCLHNGQLFKKVLIFRLKLLWLKVHSLYFW